MSARGKSAVIFIILSIAAFLIAGGAFYFFQQERAKNMELEEKLEDIKIIGDDFKRVSIELANLKSYQDDSNRDRWHNDDDDDDSDY